MSLGQTEALFEEKRVALQSMRTDTLLELKCLYTDLYHTQEKLLMIVSILNNPCFPDVRWLSG